MSCNNTLYDSLSNCTTLIRVNALLVPATPYTWMITDKFGKEFVGESVSNAQGFIDIDVTDLPDGFFNPYAGSFTLEILDGVCHKLDFKMAKYFDKIVFTISGGTRVKDNLGCDFDCNAEGGTGNNAVFTFENIANVAIPWTSFLRNLYGGTPTVQVFHEISPDVFQQVSVSVTMVGGPYDLSEIDVDNGGPASGYILIS